LFCHDKAETNISLGVKQQSPSRFFFNNQLIDEISRRLRLALWNLNTCGWSNVNDQSSMPHHFYGDFREGSM
jgi:hypothetical protein